MKVVFEYKDGYMVELKGLKLHTINDRTPMNAVLDAHLSDPRVERMYIIANDNHISNEFIATRTKDELFEIAKKYIESLDV